MSLSLPRHRVSPDRSPFEPTKAISSPEPKPFEQSLLKPSTEGDHQRRSDAAVTVLLPVYNEAATIGRTIDRVRAALPHGEIIVIDDGSVDETSEIIQSSAARVRYVSHPVNRGKGAAVTSGLVNATRPLVVIQDADLEYSPEDIPLLIRGFFNPNPPLAIYGSRYLTSQCARRPVTDQGIRLLNMLARLCGRIHTTDHATCYKVLPTRLLTLFDVRAQRFDWCAEVTIKLGRFAKVLRKSLDELPGRCSEEVDVLRECPIRYQPRSFEQGKKLRLRDGLPAARAMLSTRRWSPDPTAVVDTWEAILGDLKTV